MKATMHKKIRGWIKKTKGKTKGTQIGGEEKPTKGEKRQKREKTKRVQERQR